MQIITELSRTQPIAVSSVSMPKVDDAARQWELTMSGRFGAAVARRRRHLGLTAVQLWERTVELGYPVTRIAISKIENNTRAGKLDMAEVLILARALELPPMLLLYPSYPGGVVEFLPGWEVESERAAGWISGKLPLPGRIVPSEGVRIHPTNPGVELVQVADERGRSSQKSIRVFFEQRDDDDEGAQLLLNELNQELARCSARIEELSTELWGASDG